ncbi:component of oligomeric Golgi complex 5 [Emiliania huxleyi CCMP1516]|uniref:Conserved oligomeric Golgi complex subunit 5 n=2 Tax=Emiliania huxleyi TaxID=2903 RepID=A0A0D3K930_EMIH1|nr:component of oligomeric Golgi complex 5 [Emiliania huxleyi CCMP1516]EOD32265.1 component of oligomeric Golgi complex 5 [Emiliania huxleyi CCMP1516]|eukprot:XP_005784694.1 component of oligomeric Golgi complex 5 [Emiliania huxleyi CCMP1516]
MASQLIANLEACASRDDLGDICQAIEEAPSFDQLALAQLAIASGEAEVTAAALGRIESRLGAALGAHVAARYSELITEVDAVRSLEARLVQSHSRVERLAATVRRVRTTTVGQHEQLSGRVSQLEHMQECSSLLRRVQRLLYLCWRLHEAVDASKARRSAGGGAGSGAWRIELSSAELPKAAVALREVEEILEEEEERLDGVELVAPELQFARSVGAAVRRQADGMLREALRSLNQPSLTTALQVFFSLGCLRDKVEEAVAAAAASLGTDVSDALTNIDARAARGGRAGWVAALWGQVEAVGELLLGAATRLCLLTRVLSKRRGSAWPEADLSLIGLELMLAERPAAEAGSRAWAASEAANGATLTVLKALREDLVAEMSGMAEAAAAPLRVAVGGLAPVVTTLANPATPLPDALREAGAKVLKQLLRSGMIEEG